jgi:hypothetical protein
MFKMCSYELFKTDRNFCLFCFEKAMPTDNTTSPPWRVCETACDATSTKRQLYCGITWYGFCCPNKKPCFQKIVFYFFLFLWFFTLFHTHTHSGTRKELAVSNKNNCTDFSNMSLLNEDCAVTTTTGASNNANQTPMPTDDDGRTTTIIIVVVIVVVVLIACAMVVIAIIMRRNKTPAPVSNISVVIENKTTEKPKKSKSSKSGSVAMGIPDEGYPAEAGGTASLNYPAEAGGTTSFASDYPPQAGGGDYSEAGYGSNAAYPPQAGGDSDESSGPPA